MQLVQGDVEGAGQVPGGELAGRADVQDGQLGQARAGLVGVEGEGVFMSVSSLIFEGAPKGGVSYP